MNALKEKTLKTCSSKIVERYQEKSQCNANVVKAIWSAIISWTF